jgi:hypothetical protein
MSFRPPHGREGEETPDDERRAWYEDGRAAGTRARVCLAWRRTATEFLWNSR